MRTTYNKSLANAAEGKLNIQTAVAKLQSHRNIRTLPHGFQVVFTSKKLTKDMTKSFAYSAYGGKRGALKAAQEYRNDCIINHPSLDELRKKLLGMPGTIEEKKETYPRKDAFSNSYTGIRDLLPGVIRKPSGPRVIFVYVRNNYDGTISRIQFNTLWWGWEGAFRKAYRYRAKDRGMRLGRYPKTPQPTGIYLEALEEMVSTGWLDEDFNPAEKAKQLRSSRLSNIPEHLR